MTDYTIFMGLVGFLFALMFVTAWVIVDLIDGGLSPRETVTRLVGGYVGCIVGAICLPLVGVLAVVYIIIAMIKDDWKWYQR